MRYKNQLFTCLVLKAAWLISIRYPWFGYLNYTVRSKAQTDNSNITGCPNCNQCVRVEWQPQLKPLAAQEWPQITANSLHFAVGKKPA
jgi:hypothetical protein